SVGSLSSLRVWCSRISSCSSPSCKKRSRYWVMLSSALIRINSGSGGKGVVEVEKGDEVALAFGDTADKVGGEVVDELWRLVDRAVGDRDDFSDAVDDDADVAVVGLDDDNAG